jgi:hypothetical protein
MTHLAKPFYACYTFFHSADIVKAWAWAPGMIEADRRGGIIGKQRSGPTYP